MFSRKDNHQKRKPVETPVRVKSKPQGNAMSSTAPSILSADLAVTGTITSEGEVQLEGSVEGDIRASSITIGKKSVVKGEVIAEIVTIHGKVIGKVRGKQVQLAATARVEGDITHAQLSMENGAFFEGQCRHASDPTGTAAKSKPTPTPQSAPKAPVTPPRMGTGKAS